MIRSGTAFIKIEAIAVTPKVYLAERVGFVPDDLAPINDLRAIGTARTAQIHLNSEYEVQNKYSASRRCARMNVRKAA